MRISYWSSDVCSSDLRLRLQIVFHGALEDQLHGPPVLDDRYARLAGPHIDQHFLGQDRKSVVEGKSVSVRVDLGGRRIIKKKKDTRQPQTHNTNNQPSRRNSHKQKNKERITNL